MDPDKRIEAIEKIMKYFLVEKSALRISELDGVSGPSCAGCASDVFTGYTQGIMGLSLSYSGGENEFRLDELINIMHSSLGLSGEPGIKTLVANHLLLPDVRTLSIYLCSSENSILIDNRLLYSMNRYVSSKSGVTSQSIVRKVSEAILAVPIIHNEVFTLRGVPCPAKIEGKILEISGNTKKKIPILIIVIKRITPTLDMGAQNDNGSGEIQL